MEVKTAKDMLASLLSITNLIQAEELFPAKSPEASRLIISDPYAFLIACCLDRGTKTDIIWSIPYEMKSRLGHLDPVKIRMMLLADISALFHSLKYRPRYITDAPRTILDLTGIVVDECGGDASGLWKNKRVFEVQRTLMSIHGVGPGIANMSVLLIEKASAYRFNDEDRKRMDIKPDVHTKRVLFRMGVSRDESEQEAIDAARFLNPAFPGELDGPLWHVGRTWCHARMPECADCRVSSVCEKYEVK